MSKVQFSKLESSSSIVNNWFITLLLTVFIPAIFGFSYILQMLSSDSAVILIAVLIVFCVCVFKNYIQITQIAGEFNELSIYRVKVEINTEFEQVSTLSRHIEKLKAMYYRSNKNAVNQDNLIEILLTKMKRQNSHMNLFSGILITIGLIGTIIGMIGTVSGLGAVMEASGDKLALVDGMKQSLSGMGTAFYTTLAGALLGGICLKVLHAYTDNKITMYVSELAEVMEVRVLPQMRTKDLSEGIAQALAKVLGINEQ